ncbi:MAG: alpha/beta fold hydrolase [Bacteroidota bacterium]
MIQRTVFLLPLILLFLLVPEPATGQEIAGRWYGEAEVDSTQHYLFDIRYQERIYYGYFDLPGTGLFRIPFDSVSFAKNGEVYLEQKSLPLTYRGTWSAGKEEIRGIIYHQQDTAKLSLSHTPTIARPQLPKGAIPYTEKELSFVNPDGDTLLGSLSYPTDRDSLILVVLISGSGPQDRNEEILGHQPFRVLSDYLSRRGIAVFRYDDRGYGDSGGRFRPATSADYAEDTRGALKMLQGLSDFSFYSIGLAGHSEGGNIAPMVASSAPEVDFLIFLAAPGLSNYESYLSSLDLVLREYPETYDRDYPFFQGVYQSMASISDKEILRDTLEKQFTGITEVMEEEELSLYGGVEAYIQSNVQYHCSDWYHYYLQFDITPFLQSLKIPILALNGDQDHSVVAAPNLAGFEQTLQKARHPNYRTILLPGVNHFFQPDTDPSFDSVYFNEMTFSPLALETIFQWIQEIH